MHFPLFDPTLIFPSFPLYRGEPSPSRLPDSFFPALDTLSLFSSTSSLSHPFRLSSLHAYPYLLCTRPIYLRLFPITKPIFLPFLLPPFLLIFLSFLFSFPLPSSFSPSLLSFVYFLFFDVPNLLRYFSGRGPQFSPSSLATLLWMKSLTKETSDLWMEFIVRRDSDKYQQQRVSGLS